MQKFLSVILFFGLTAPAIADECPMGYTPTKYTQLEYIESTGTQYIDTGINTNGIVCELDYEFTFLKNESALFGYWTTNKIYHATLYQQQAYFGAGFTREINLSIDDFYTLNRNIISLSDNGKFTFNGNVIYDNPVSSSGSSGPILLFGRSVYSAYNEIETNTLSKIRVFSFKIDKGIVSLRHFIPAKRNNDGEIGMYDTVTGHFFTNAGTGEFIAGPEILTENTCFPCPPNTYKDFVGNSDCIPCPDTFSSPSGATSINECGRILHIGDYVAHMPFGRRTEHGLCTMFDGKKYCADVYEKQ